MNDFYQKVGNLLKEFSPANAVDILLISAVIFVTFRFLIKNNSLNLVKIFLLIICGALIADIIGLGISSQLLKYLFMTCYLAFIIIYSSEIRRSIWAGSKRLQIDKFADSKVTDEELKHAADEIVKAVQNMAKRDIGALIIFVKGQPPTGIMESGVILNSLVSSQLLESIFIPKSPLHDGAVLIKDDKLLAAGCFLPLSLEINLPKEFGTRHRAAIGITESHNVMAVVVSEETGIISIAKDGELKRYVDGEMLKSAIENVFGLTYREESKWHRKK